MRVAVSWSGGKDSCLAYYRAILRGFNVAYLLNIAVREHGEYRVHGLNPAVIRAQSQALGIPMIQRQASWETYENVFKEAVRSLKKLGVEGVVFGDIWLEEHKEWIDKVCSELEVAPITPLWKNDPKHILEEFIENGFEALIVCIRADLLPKEMLGRKVDEHFLEDLCRFRDSRFVDLCGEFGEYHTLVINGPVFLKKLRILSSRVIWLQPYYWVLNVERWDTVEKK